jgi:hypothetical protein
LNDTSVPLWRREDRSVEKKTEFERRVGLALDDDSKLTGEGEVFRKGGESLCRCGYDLTITVEGPFIDRGRIGPRVVKGGSSSEVDGTITPHGMTTDALRPHVDKAGRLELRLEDGRWLDIQFTSSRGNRVRGVNGPRGER